MSVCKNTPPCKARHFCHCATLAAAGWCKECKTECGLIEEPLEFPELVTCPMCNSRVGCICQLLVDTGYCPTCLTYQKGEACETCKK